MHPVRKQRLFVVLLIILGTSAAAALLFYSLSENMNFFYSPADIQAGKAPLDKSIRVGGLVVPGSVKRQKSGIKVSFTITDNAAQLAVQYEGILPDMFSEGQGVIAAGSLKESGDFQATQVLAKHDENYMPPEVHDALKKGAEQTAVASDSALSQHLAEEQ